MIAADGAAAHYATVRVQEAEEHSRFTLYTCVLAHYKRDSLGIPLRPMDFHATKEVAENEKWTLTRAALTARLQASS